jgi:hypothetical protein
MAKADLEANPPSPGTGSAVASAERLTSNTECRMQTLNFCHWALGVKRWTFS